MIELQTAEEVRAQARKVAARIAQQRRRPKPQRIYIEEPAPEPMAIEVKHRAADMPLSSPPFPVHLFTEPQWLPHDCFARKRQFKQMIALLCDRYGVEHNDLLSDRRSNGKPCHGSAGNLVIPRHVGYYLSRKLTTKSLPEIGRDFGGRDHTTILHGIRRIEDRMANDAKFKDEVDGILKQLGYQP